jgi:hypothetical protein
MAITITDDRMTSDQTCHTAWSSQYAAADGRGAWIVSWLPLRLLDRNQAITAMTLAEWVATHEAPRECRHVALLAVWAAELHMSAAEALRQIEAATRARAHLAGTVA